MDLSFYKTMGMGGTPISPSMEIELCDFMEKHGSCAKASVGYGMSELASAACTELNRYYGKTGSVGLPLAYVNIKVIDTETEREMMLGEEGELVISSPGLMIEYFNNPEETKTAISTDEEGVRWIKTGDLGYVDEDGFVFITQKLKRIYTTRKDVNSPIFHIFPDYIANVICEVENVEECVVVCLQHPELKSVPVAFCVIQDHTFDCIPVIKEYCRNHLPAHSIPHEFCEIDEIPKTVIGKPDYQALEKMAQIQSEVTPGVK